MIAAPGKLPPGAGAALLNVIALLAERPLRYAGPYPTPALYRALRRSFRTTATEGSFCADVMARAARVAMDEIAIDFAEGSTVRRIDRVIVPSPAPSPS